MGQQKYNKPERLSRLIGVRVSEAFYNKLEAQRASTNCQTIGEFARKVLLEEKINYYHRDAAMESVAAELAGIKRELNVIGSNINQVTRYFNSTALPNQKIFEALKILDEYKKTGGPVEKVLTIISTIKWSPK